MKTSSTLVKAPKFLVTAVFVGAAFSGLVAIASSHDEANNVSACTYRFGIVHGTPGEVASVGAGTLRTGFIWSHIEPQPGQWNWAHYDGLVAEAQNKQVEIVAILAYGNPAYPPHRFYTPPTDIQRWLTFVANAVNRYKHAVRYWEVWNEADSAAFWEDPDAAAYTRLLIPTYKQIKASDSNAIVLMAGLAGGASFLEGMYQNGAKGAFDVANYHTYSVPTVEGTQAFRMVMAAHGDQNKPIWITETGSPGKEPEFPLVQQAQIVRDIYRSMLDNPPSALAERVYWYAMRDYSVNDDGFGAYGLLFENGTRKPAADAYSQMARTCGPGIPPPAAPTDIRVVRSP